MARGRPKSMSASSAARVVRPVNSTSSTRTMVRSSIENGISVRRTIGCGPDGLAHQVVAVEGDVEGADRHVVAGDVLERGGDAPGQRHAARAHADDGQLLDAAVALDDLVGDAHQRARDAIGVHHDGHCAASLRSAAPHGTGDRGPGTGKALVWERAVSADSAGRRSGRRTRPGRDVRVGMFTSSRAHRPAIKESRASISLARSRLGSGLGARGWRLRARDESSGTGASRCQLTRTSRDPLCDSLKPFAALPGTRAPGLEPRPSHGRPQRP